MLSNRDSGKWGYPEHTKKKHAILIRYMKAWLSILGSGARAAGHLAHLVIVDAFAGRGRYTTNDPGSPLLLRDIASRVISDARVDQVELFYIESDEENWSALRSELESAEQLFGVIERGPIHDTFERSAPSIIETVRHSRRSSFWSIDPFGYAGLPLTLIRRILAVPRAEVFVTLMVRDMNRFLDDPPHRLAIAKMLDLDGDELITALARVKQSDNRMEALRDLYVERLEANTIIGSSLYVTSVRVAEDGPDDTVYYLVHASSSAKGKREMKKAIWIATGGLNAVLGTKDPTVVAESIGQTDMFSPAEQREQRVNYSGLRELLRAEFAGRRLEFVELLKETAAKHAFDGYIDAHIKTALEYLADRHLVRRYRRGALSMYKLDERDFVEFPSA